jgi:flagellar hook assembly protein FlgD
LIPNVYSLGQNYPNPFNPITTIPFQVSSSQSPAHTPVHTTLVVYNILGQKVKTLFEDKVLSGIYEVIWDGKNDKGSEVTSGIYFYRLETGGFRQTKKMILLR